MNENKIKCFAIIYIKTDVQAQWVQMIIPFSGIKNYMGANDIGPF